MISIKKSTSGAIALKAAQQFFGDLNPSIRENTTPDLIRYTGEEFARLGAAGAAAYTIDRINAGIENIAHLPKCLKGLAPALIATIGVGALHHNYGEHISLEQTQNIWQATGHLLGNYKESIAQLANFDLSAHTGHLTGALVTTSSGIRWGKNLFSSISDYVDKKQQEKHKE